MKAWTNIILMSVITLGLFLYAFLQPVLAPDDLTNQFHMNPFALIFGFIALFWDIKQYRRIKSHYKHLEFNIVDSNCQDCKTKSEGSQS